jgi:hypothetical protein
MYSRRIGRYTYQWTEETLDSFKGEINLVSLSRILTDTSIGYVRDSINFRLGLFEDIPTRGGDSYPMLVEVGDSYQVLRGHNTVVWHIHNQSNGLACHVFREEDLINMPHLKTKDWQCITVT